MNSGASLQGLDDDAVRARQEAGQLNRSSTTTSRTVAEILRANILTRFNAILASLLLVVIVVGPFQDGLFGIILVVNALIGIVQELRAKRVLDRLGLLTAPAAKVVRNGAIVEIPVDEVVLDDLLVAGRGDQIIVDGLVAVTDDLEIDESLVSGEPDPVAKVAGDSVLSGSFVVAGTGQYRATRVGDDAFAQRLQQEARRFAPARSELQRGIDRILQFVTWAIIPAAVLLTTSQVLRSNLSISDGLRGSVAGVSAMVPEGLVLLTTVAFAVSALRLARRRVLVQELNAVEGLARVDVVCMDKTGTLTEPGIHVLDVESLSGGPVDEPLGVLVSAEPSPNRTLQAIGAKYSAPAGWDVEGRVPFSSARKWSGVTVAGQGTWVLGAPDVLFSRPSLGDALGERVVQHTRQGRRVLLLAHAEGVLSGGELPAPLTPAALVVLDERTRADAPDTVRYLLEQGVTCKVISGDDPETVAAVADRVGIPRRGVPVDGRALPTDPEALAEVVENASVFGRIAPEQKRSMVAALQSRGHVVAMTGDGVNDVAALKAADIGIAMGTGSPASRAVGQLILLDDSFATFPEVVAEGRRVIANIERVTNLFVTKTVYATLLAVVVGVVGVAFPFYPRHLTIISSLTIGIPGFFLALAPTGERALPGFLTRVLRFTAPAGAVAATATYSAYALARHTGGVSIVQARTTAVIALFIVAFWVLIQLARPLTQPKGVMVGALAVAFAVLLAVPGVRHFFQLALPGPALGSGTLAISALAVLTLSFLLRVISARATGPPAARPPQVRSVP